MTEKVIMPKLGETMEEGEIIKWLKKEGDKVNRGEPLMEIATDKANMEVEAATSGFLRKIVVKEGEKAPVTTTIAYIADTMEEEAPVLKEEEGMETNITAQKREEKVPEEEKKSPAAEKMVKASPLARRLAREKGVDLATIQGTGPGGRIVKEDVLKAAEKRSVAEPQTMPPGKKVISFSRTEKIVAERMQQSKREIPHFYLTSEVDLSEAVKLRNDLVEEFEQAKSVRISFTDLIMKACARALMKVPRVNSHYIGGEAIIFSRININLAIARKQGLVVPVIKEVDRKDVFEIARERTDLVAKATEDKLSLEDMEGGTFTLSNMGMMQIKNFLAIINPPQVCLLSTGQIKEQVIAIEGEILTAPIMEMTLSCDHRVVDGYLGSQFLQEVKKGLEKPALLLV